MATARTAKRVHFHENVVPITVPIYGQVVLVLPGTAYLSDLYRQMGDDESAKGPFTEGTASRMTLPTGGKLYTICVDVKCIDTIVHEVYHIVNFIFEDLGIEPDLYNDEPGAYLMGWLAGEVHDALKGVKIVPFGKPLPPETPAE